MKIAMVSRSDESAGGASRAAHILAVGLRNHGCEVDEWIIVRKDRHNIDCKLVFPGAFSQYIPFVTNIGSRLVGLPDILGFDILKLPRLFLLNDYDIIHFHDTVTAVSPITILKTATIKPTVLTLHDCSAFTAGCTYPDSCNKYQANCGDCPEIRSWPLSSPALDFSGLLQRLKRLIHRNVDVSVVAPSEWIRQLALSSGVFRKEPKLIPYGIDLDFIRPLNKPIVRDILNLPIEKQIIAFAATHVDDPRKGFRYALEAVRQFDAGRRRVTFLSIGHPPRDMKNWNSNDFDCRFLGFVYDLRLMAQYFAAADVFLFPTLRDNLPFVVLENMAAGTPTIAFRTGGVPEMVLHERTGYLVDQGDSDGLVRGLHEALRIGKAACWGVSARCRAEDLFSLERHAISHLRLYETLAGDCIAKACRPKSEKSL